MAIDPTATQQNFVQSYRTAINSLLDARANLKSLRELGGTLGYPGSFGANAFGGANTDLQGADLSAAFGAMDTLEQVLTNFATTPPQPTATLAAILKFRR